MLNGFFKNRVLGWTKEEAPGAAATLVQAEVGDPHRDGGYWGTSRMVRLSSRQPASQPASQASRQAGRQAAAIVLDSTLNEPGEGMAGSAA